MKKIFLLLCTIGLAFVTISNIIVRSTTNKLIFDTDSLLPQNSIAIIFGAGINNNVPSKYLKDRLDAGIQLYKNHKVEKLLLSGDNGRDEHDELTVMKLYCLKNGVDSNKIYLDYAGFDSYSTMYRAKKIFQIDSAILITQKYHLNRVLYIGNKLGLHCVGYIADQGSYSGYKYVKFREYFAISKSVWDVLRRRKPHFLGNKLSINGPSNYTKQ